MTASTPSSYPTACRNGQSEQTERLKGSTQSNHPKGQAVLESPNMPMALNNRLRDYNPRLPSECIMSQNTPLYLQRAGLVNSREMSSTEIWKTFLKPAVLLSLSLPILGSALVISPTFSRSLTTRSESSRWRRYMSPPSDWQEETGNDPNKWMSSDDESLNGSEGKDWQSVLDSKADGSFWSSFEPSPEEGTDLNGSANDLPAVSTGDDLEDTDAEAWLNTLASISAEEVEYNMKEADRADKVRQMQEWGFDSDTIKNTFNVAVDDSLETKDEVIGMKQYRETSYWDDEDWKKVESHTKVEKDPETGEPMRQQMVYVDEHTCIGCTNCAMIAQSTFFMDDEHGRARVFQQWGDDDETIAVAIETCPVDCIHYVPYDELVKLEVERRDQNINFKARLVSQAEYGGGGSHMVGSAAAFTAPQQISGNMGSRCSNCPSRGCRTCPSKFTKRMNVLLSLLTVLSTDIFILQQCLGLARIQNTNERRRKGKPALSAIVSRS
jgi:ferredoxin